MSYTTCNYSSWAGADKPLGSKFLYGPHHVKTGFLHMRKQRVKDADQLCSNCTADQRLCFHYTDSTIPVFFPNPKFQASSHLLWLYSPVCVGPGRKPLRPVFSQRGLYKHIKLSITLVIWSFFNSLTFKQFFLYIINVREIKFDIVN